MGERRGTKGLELWCRRMTEGYPGVEINNMTTSWRDGLAFCAIIHHFRPDLIDFSKLNKNDVYKNNLMAFQIAERHLGIPALLEPDDMVKFAVPDRLSILTYLSQFYQTFVVAQGSPSRIVPKRTANAPDRTSVSPTPTSPAPKMHKPILSISQREPCTKCGLPVCIAERLKVNNQLYHRTCFCCARCHTQLTLTNYYETEIENQFCCETCPDEEQHQQHINRSLSDEEKSSSLKKFETKDDYYSDLFESALEDAKDPMLTTYFSVDFEQTVPTARSRFINSQLTDSDEDKPDLPKSVLPVTSVSEPPDLLKFIKNSEELDLVDHLKDNIAINDSICNSNVSSLDSIVNSVQLSDSDKNQPETANKLLDNITKENFISSKNEKSVVKSRMLLFESMSDKSSADSKPKDQVPSVDVVFDSSKNKSNHEEEKCEAINSALVCDDSVILISSTEESIDVSHSNTNERNVEAVENTLNASVISISDTEDSLDLSLKQEQLTTSNDKSASDTENTSVCKVSEKEVVLPENKSSVAYRKSYYPEDLNPFGDETDEDHSPEASLNPFGDDDFEDDDEVAENIPPTPAVRRKFLVKDGISPGTYVQSYEKEPAPRFECGESDAAENAVPKPAARKRISVRDIERIRPSEYGYIERYSVNPFEQHDIGKSARRTSLGVPNPKPRASNLERSSIFGSNSSLSSTRSSIEPGRYKKKQAPRPPTVSLNTQDSAQSSLASTPCTSAQHSPKSLQRSRKFKKAPPPPPPTSTPLPLKTEPSRLSVSPISFNEPKSEIGMELEKEKVIKDEFNRNRQSQNTTDTHRLSLDKSTHGKWKRGKGPAPSRPIPERRTVKPLPVEDIRHELGVIEIQLQGLEKQGVHLEHLIREKCEGPGSEVDTPLTPEVENLILDLFELINEKNLLFRRQAELMYLRRQQRLEEEHADLEYQIRCLLVVPELNKTDSDKAREEELIKRLYEVVEQRNEIVECLEMDRVREAEEDDSINTQLNIYTSKNTKSPLEESSVKKKTKKSKLKCNKKIDFDKDIDESETVPKKEKKKKKFNIF